MDSTRLGRTARTATHRDPFDRFIAATAIEMGWVLISKDAEFDALDETRGWQGRVWS